MGRLWIAVIIVIVLILIYLLWPSQKKSSRSRKGMHLHRLRHCRLSRPEDPRPKRVLYSINQNIPVMRPGSRYDMDEYGRSWEIEPAYTIKMLYTANCAQHPLYFLFHQLAKDLTGADDCAAGGRSAQAGIVFTKEIIDNTVPYSRWDSAFPIILKIRRDGQILKYNGYTNYGQLYDWIMNEALLF